MRARDRGVGAGPGRVADRPAPRVQRAGHQGARGPGAQTPGPAVRKIAHEIFDVAETAKRALARHWASRTAAEREEFTQLFADLLESTYIARIEQYGGERIKYTHETIDGDNAIVRARVVTKKGTEVPVESRLLRRGDRWLIYDVLIENVSLIANYRSQFDRIVRTSSYEELVRRLKSKRDEFLNEQSDTARGTSG